MEAITLEMSNALAQPGNKNGVLLLIFRYVDHKDVLLVPVPLFN